MKAWENVPVSKKNNSESLVTCVHLFEKKCRSFCYLKYELIHDISKVKIVLKNKNIAKKSDFQLNSLAII